MVAWRDVEKCTFSATRNALGDTINSNFVLHGRHKLLLRLSPQEPDARRLLDAARFYLRAESSAESPTQSTPGTTL